MRCTLDDPVTVFNLEAAAYFGVRDADPFSQPLGAPSPAYCVLLRMFQRYSTQ